MNQRLIEVANYHQFQLDTNMLGSSARLPLLIVVNFLSISQKEEDQIDQPSNKVKQE